MTSFRTEFIFVQIIFGQTFVRKFIKSKMFALNEESSFTRQILPLLPGFRAAGVVVDANSVVYCMIDYV